MKRISTLVLALALTFAMLPAARGVESALPMTCGEYEEQYRTLNPAYTGSGAEWETMYAAYKVYLVNAYATAHPGELEALTAEELTVMLGGTGGETGEELLFGYVSKRNAIERICAEAAAYRVGCPQLWADFDANAYFQEKWGAVWEKEAYKRELLIRTEMEFRENLFVQRFAAQAASGMGSGLLTQPAAPVTPTAPSWVAAEDYITFPGDAAYQPGNWDYIQVLRRQAEEGGLLDYEGRDWAEGSPAQCYETALIRLKCAENYRDDPFEAKAAFLSAGRAFHAAESGWYDQSRGRDETYYRLSVEKYRAYVLYHPEYSENLGRGLVPALDALGMTLDDFFNAPYMDRVSQADRAVVEGLAAEYQEVYDREKNRVSVYLDGEPLIMDTEPQVLGERVMVPIRAISEALGADVGWNEESWEVTLTRAGSVVALTPGETVAAVDGEKLEMDVAPYADQNRTYIPARYVAEFFGQTVTWNGEERRVEISEDKSGWEDSGLEGRLLPMGSLLGFLEGGDPAQFGFYPRPPYTETAHSDHGVNENRTVAPSGLCRETLAETWEIPDREALLETVEDILKAGHNADFQRAADEVRGLSDWQIANRTEKLGDVDQYMWPYTKALTKKWGEAGIRAWDLCRAVTLVRWGYTAGYVTYGEAMELLEPAAEELAERFSSWDQVYENFLEGYYWCLREDLGDGTVWDTDLGMAYQYLKNSPDTRSLFDDAVLAGGKDRSAGG